MSMVSFHSRRQYGICCLLDRNELSIPIKNSKTESFFVTSELKKIQKKRERERNTGVIQWEEQNKWERKYLACSYLDVCRWNHSLWRPVCFSNPLCSWCFSSLRFLTCSIVNDFLPTKSQHLTHLLFWPDKSFMCPVQNFKPCDSCFLASTLASYHLAALR